MSKAKPTDRQTQVRFVRFLVVGGSAYAVQVATMKLFLLGCGMNLAFSLSFLCSTTTHYSLNRWWALPSTRVDTGRQLREYLGVAALSYVINFLLFRLCVDVLGLGRIWATAIAVPPSTLVVFLLLNFRVFRHAGHAATSTSPRDPPE
ncbi:MAG: GtrA family protein [Verrucomicrobia bacterium]|nr:GtrA family protein [Verrucomicrobiota bacterium]